MRIEYKSDDGFLGGQFVVYADNVQERAILCQFVNTSTDDRKWKFHLHGWSSTLRETPYDGPDSFNFGYVDAEKRKKERSLVRRFVQALQKLKRWKLAWVRQ